MSIVEVDLVKTPVTAGTEDNLPLRARASSRFSPTHSYRSTPTEISPIPSTPSYPFSSGRASPLSGNTRTLGINDHETNHVPSSVDALPASFTDLDVELLQDRLTSRDFSAEPEGILDVSYLEPRPYERINTNLSEIITAQPSTIRDSIDLLRFGGHRDTFAILGLWRRQQKEMELPVRFFRCLLHYIDFETYLSIRLSCRSWSLGISQVCPPIQRAVRRLPTEVLAMIFSYMSPMEFNSARHTCRVWMAASLEARLLTHMLKCGGWWTAALADHTIAQGRRPSSTSEVEWTLSKRIATECSLRPDWTGDGLVKTAPSEASGTGEYADPHNQRPQRPPRTLELKCEINFSELDHNSRGRSILRFTSSTCGRYLLAFKNNRIFVIHLGGDGTMTSQYPGDGPQAIKSLDCPREVLGVAMDSSSGSHVLVALLKGRSGFMCDFTERRESKLQLIMPRVRLPTWTISTERQSNFLDDEVDVELPLPLASLTSGEGSVRNPWAFEGLPLTISPENYDSSPSPSMPYKLFTNLCSEDNPPLSIAVCPQQICVAFGCSTGIELHWVDSISGEKLSRWVLWDRPVYNLYCLPPRPDDAPRKLRLISSPALQDEKAAYLHKFYSDKKGKEDEVGLNSMNNFGSNNDTEKSTDEFKFINVKPCSDGWHVLFLDAETGNVCLGIDRVDVEADEGRFSVIATFTSPKDFGVTISLKPICYAVAAELSWGPRVVVGYEDESIYLFAVPSDIFHVGRGGDQWDWLYTWDTYGVVNEGGSGYPIWPHDVQGIKIGEVEGLLDVAVQGQEGGVTVWAFSAQQKGFCWDLYIGEPKKPKIYKVLDDGLGFRVENEVDEDGDWRMRDAPPLRQDSGFDGAGSEMFTANHATHLIQEGSDVSMRDIDDDEGYFSCEEDDLISVQSHETPTHSQRRLNNTPLGRSDISMEEFSDNLFPHSDPILSNPDPAIPSNPNKRRRLNNSLSHLRQSSKSQQAEQRSFDPDHQTIERVSSAFAISIPGRKRRWTGSEIEPEDWIPDYLGMARDLDELDQGAEAGEAESKRMGGGDDDQGLDLWALAKDVWDVEVLKL